MLQVLLLLRPSLPVQLRLVRMTVVQRYHGYCNGALLQSALQRLHSPQNRIQQLDVRISYELYGAASVVLSYQILCILL